MSELSAPRPESRGSSAARAGRIGAEVTRANFLRRTLALALDDLLVFVSVVVLLVGFAALVGDDGYYTGFLLGTYWFLSIPLIAFYWALAFALAEWSFRGRTPGKVVFGLAVRSAVDGGTPGFAQLLGRELGRALLALLLFIPFVLDGLAALRDPRGQTWHDRRADTVVVYVGYGWLVRATTT